MLLTRINPVAKRIATPTLGSVRTLSNLIQTTHWHRIVSWDQFRNPYLSERVHKGDLIYVEGPIHYRAYTAKDGTEKHLTEITLKNFQALTPKEQQE
ncbi:hypothetical protein BGZ54_000435 [Gamsiella multidivaricata]|nr:hypothetical protein BGZ54_000435 [Gamsiella multidivaricata]